MTLVARAKPPSHHKKYTGKHHRHSKVYHKAYWPYLPLLAVVAVGLLLNTVLPGQKGVLGYATDMSIQGLLDGTNNQRSANGLGALALNGTLDTAAQNKANDMAARDYWSHNTPDGQTPWSFMTAAGYNYNLAGENLAYGFSTSSDTITGWMNSPGHRANILNSGYLEVGFGIVDIPNYQGTGPETLVVAMYASPASGSVAAATSTPAPSPSTVNNSTPANKSYGGSAATPNGEAPSANSQATENAPTPAVVTPIKQPLKKVSEPAPKQISRMQLLTAGKAPWSAFVISLLGTAGLLFFLLRHGFAWHKVLTRGEKLILHHPMLDVLFVSLATLALILSRSTGLIR